MLSAGQRLGQRLRSLPSRALGLMWHRQIFSKQKPELGEAPRSACPPSLRAACVELPCCHSSRGSRHVAVLPCHSARPQLGYLRACTDAVPTRRGSGHRGGLIGDFLNREHNCQDTRHCWVSATVPSLHLHHFNEMGIINLRAECEEEGGSPAPSLEERRVLEHCAPIRAHRQGLCGATCPSCCS